MACVPKALILTDLALVRIELIPKSEIKQKGQQTMCVVGILKLHDGNSRLITKVRSGGLKRKRAAKSFIKIRSGCNRINFNIDLKSKVAK